MPIFDYTCQKCDLVDERFVDFSTRDDQYCNKCDGKMKRVFSIGKLYKSDPISRRLWKEAEGINRQMVSLGFKELK